MERYIGSPPFQWQGAINGTSPQALGLTALFHPLIHWRDLIGGYQMKPVGNAAATGVVAELGRTYSLDGTDDCAYVTLPDAWKLQRFTVSTWIYCTTLTGTNQTIFSVLPRGASSDGRGTWFYLNSGGVVGAIGNGTAYTYAVLNATHYANTLYHMAFTYDGAATRLWRNGVLIATTNTTVTIQYADKNTSTGPNPASAYIGAYHDSDNTSPDTAVDILYDFTGHIGPVSLYNRALSAAEIWSLYDPQTRWELYQPPRPMVWWMPPATTSAIPSMMQSYRQRRG